MSRTGLVLAGIFGIAVAVSSLYVARKVRRHYADAEFHSAHAGPSDSKFQGASMVAPKVLMLVYRWGDGDKLAGAQWKVARKDGKAMAVKRVSRQSVPVGQPAYEVGFAGKDDLRVVMVEHRIFLTLAEAVGAKEELHITHGGHSDAFAFDESRSVTPVVQLNQVGYNPRATKRWAYVSLWLGDGGPLSLKDFPTTVDVIRDDGSTVATLPLAVRAAKDSDAGTEVREVDLASIPAGEGVRLRIRIAGVGVSYPTQVSESAVFKAFYVTARGLFHNRWAGDLLPKTTAWSRPQDHKTVFTTERADAFELFEKELPKTGERPLIGGYHDAGDFDQRPMHTVVAQQLMRAYQLNPQAFADGQLTIPESGNGVPDILDEAHWGVRGWLALQEKDGGVRGGVESYRHPWGVYLASDDPLPYYTFARNGNVSARVAGIAAALSRLLAPFDPKGAASLRAASIKAFTWAKAHGATAPFLLYGASELFALTHEGTYKAEFERLWASIGPDGAFNRYANENLELSDYAEAGRVMPDYFLAYLTSGQASPTILAAATAWLTRDADEVAARFLESPHAHRNGRRVDTFAWGQAVVMGKYADAIFARMALGGLDAVQTQRYIDALSVGQDYVLGANPAGFVYITGLGSVSPQEPLHLDSLAWLKAAKPRPPVPGIPVYGPSSELPSNEWYEAGKRAFHPTYADSPPLLRYADIRSFVVNNEFSVWEVQAPHVEHFGVLMPAHAMQPPAAWLPGGAGHASGLP